MSLYLIEILHQTTTSLFHCCRFSCCILSKFYIKPQHFDLEKRINYVVSYRNSTSNHNPEVNANPVKELYLIEILHQTTTTLQSTPQIAKLYLIEILHQTTTHLSATLLLLRCILSKFYIKPQQRFEVEIPNPRCILSKFYIKPQLRNASS